MIIFRLLLPLCCLIGLAGPLSAAERILSFHSDIEILPDSSMVVTESIKVRAEGQQIKQGIYRDFPTDYRDRMGNRYRVDFTVLEVLRDGRAESFHTKPQGNGVRIYMGRKGEFLQLGDYAYQLRYRTARQLGYFDEHDELYWNVNGNGWRFPIDRLSARVFLPPEVPLDSVVPEAYTGPKGAKGRDYRAAISRADGITFSGTRNFGVGEGMSIVVSWPKGFVKPPTHSEKAAYLLQDNRSWIYGLSSLLLLSCYYLLVWRRFGRDPAAGVIIPLYEPPKGFSPASTRFVRRMGYDHRCFAAGLVNLAVKGALIIEEADGFTLKRAAQPLDDLAAGERQLLKGLFGSIAPAGGTRSSLSLEKKHHKVIGKALKSHKSALERDYGKRFFRTNTGWLIPGIVLSLLGFSAVIIGLPDPTRIISGGFLTVWLTFWSIAVFGLGKKVWSAWRNQHGGLEIFGAIFITLFSLPFFAAEVVVIGLLAKEVSPALPTIMLGLIGLNLLFYYLLKAPTRAGRKILDSLAGFQLYLEVAEKEDMNLRHPEEGTKELFERHLPYALALGVEQAWAERFADSFADLAEAGEETAPSWYSGRHWNSQNLAGFSRAVGGSLSSAVASSSTAPGSSSGSGGGGSSGGGGGGGGGGGW